MKAGRRDARADPWLSFALRFPRLMGYRPDKSARDATTIKELERLFELQFNKKEKKEKAGTK